MSKAGDIRDKKRMENMGKLQNELVKSINDAKLPLQDLLTVLIILSKQVENDFMKKMKL